MKRGGGGRRGVEEREEMVHDNCHHILSLYIFFKNIFFHYTQVSIGCNGNQETCIVDFSTCSKFSHGSRRVHSQAEDPDALSSREFRPFWIAWTRNTLLVGKGELIGNAEITSHTWQGNMMTRAIFIGGHDNARFELKIGKSRVIGKVEA